MTLSPFILIMLESSLQMEMSEPRISSWKFGMWHIQPSGQVVSTGGYSGLLWLPLFSELGE